MTTRNCFWALLLFIFSACSPANTEQPVTPDEARKFAQEIEAAIEKRRSAILNDIIDEPEFARRMASSMNMGKVSKRMIRSVVKGVAEADFGGKIVQAIGKEGSYRLVKVYTKNNRQHILFRLLSSDAGLNYHDFELLKRKNKLKAADIFIYSMGENFSFTMGQIISATGSPDLSNKKAREVAQIREVRKLLTQEKFKEAQEMLDGFSPEMRRQKSILILRAEVASNISDTLYTAVLRELEAQYPGEPNMHLMNLERHFMEKNYEQALQSVNRLDELIDKDPYMDYYRYLMLTQMKRNAEALGCLERLVKNMPDFSMGMLELMITYYDDGKKEQARELKETYRLNHKLDQKKLDDLLEAYPGL